MEKDTKSREQTFASEPFGVTGEPDKKEGRGSLKIRMGESLPSVTSSEQHFLAGWLSEI
jgi:hypothetical protein